MPAGAARQSARGAWDDRPPGAQLAGRATSWGATRRLTSIRSDRVPACALSRVPRVGEGGTEFVAFSDREPEKLPFCGDFVASLWTFRAESWARGSRLAPPFRPTPQGTRPTAWRPGRTACSREVAERVRGGRGGRGQRRQRGEESRALHRRAARATGAHRSEKWGLSVSARRSQRCPSERWPRQRSIIPR
jgi:hypothetical protein